MAKQVTQTVQANDKASGTQLPPVIPVAGAVIPHINPKALQKELGPTIIRMLAGAEKDKQSLDELRQQIGRKQYEAIAKLTAGVLHVAKNDSNVSLADHFASGDGSDKKRMALNETLYLALGMKEVIKVGTGTAQADRVVWARSCKDYLPQYGEATDTVEYDRKNTFRTNLAKQLNKAAGAALDLMKRKIDARVDETQGTLLISGPEVQKQFGVPQVALNEKQNVENDAGLKVTLKEKPSFQALYNNAAKSEGLVVKSKSSDRTNRPIVDPSAAIVELSTVMLNAMGRVKEGELSKPAEEALKQIRDKIDAMID
jgi:hypothetical protein